MNEQDLRDRAEEMVAAYNAQDFEKFGSYLAENVRFRHNNRGGTNNLGIEAHSRQEVVDLVSMFARDALPDRVIGPPVREAAVNGRVLYRESVFSAVPLVDVPLLGGSAGEKLELGLCTVLTFGDDGLVIEYQDYG